MRMTRTEWAVFLALTVPLSVLFFVLFVLPYLMIPFRVLFPG